MAAGERSGSPDGESPGGGFELGSLREGATNVRVLADGQKCVLVRRGDRVTGFREVCPHMGGPLGEGVVCRDGTIKCPWHGYRYDLETGLLRGNPNVTTFAALRGEYASWKPESAPRYRLPMLEAVVEGDRVHVRRHKGEAR